MRPLPLCGCGRNITALTLTGSRCRLQSFKQHPGPTCPDRHRLKYTCRLCERGKKNKASRDLIPVDLMTIFCIASELLHFCFICLSESNPCIKHYHIKETKDNPKRYYVAEKYVFDSIPLLINYHQHNGGGESRRTRGAGGLP